MSEFDISDFSDLADVAVLPHQADVITEQNLVAATEEPPAAVDDAKRPDNLVKNGESVA